MDDTTLLSSSYTLCTVHEWDLYLLACSCLSHLPRILPAVSATVFLRDAVLVVAPDVYGGKDERHQHSKAAEEGKDGNALLLVLDTHV